MPRKYIPKLPGSCRSCGSPLTGHGSKRYCNRTCLVRDHKRQGKIKPPPLEQQNRYREKRRLRLVAEAPVCSICGQTTQRKSTYYKSESLVVAPEGVELCKRHFMGLSSFIRQNDYQSFDIDDVYAAFLIRLTFTNSDRVKTMRMIRDAFHAGAHP